MRAFKLDSGNLLIPIRACDPETGAVGDGMVEVETGMLEYEDWLPYAVAVPHKSHGVQISCPRCGAAEVVPMLYGLPLREHYERVRGKVIFGGCLRPHEPVETWVCADCQTCWDTLEGTVFRVHDGRWRQPSLWFPPDLQAR